MLSKASYWLINAKLFIFFCFAFNNYQVYQSPIFYKTKESLEPVAVFVKNSGVKFSKEILYEWLMEIKPRFSGRSITADSTYLLSHAKHQYKTTTKVKLMTQNHQKVIHNNGQLALTCVQVNVNYIKILRMN